MARLLLYCGLAAFWQGVCTPAAPNSASAAARQQVLAALRALSRQCAAESVPDLGRPDVSVAEVLAALERKGSRPSSTRRSRTSSAPRCGQTRPGGGRRALLGAPVLFRLLGLTIIGVPVRCWTALAAVQATLAATRQWGPALSPRVARGCTLEIRRSVLRGVLG